MKSFVAYRGRRIIHFRLTVMHSEHLELICNRNLKSVKEVAHMYLLLWYDSRSIDPIGERLGQGVLASVVAGDTHSGGSSIPAPHFTPIRNRSESPIADSTSLSTSFSDREQNGQRYVSCNLHSHQSIRHAHNSSSTSLPVRGPVANRPRLSFEIDKLPHLLHASRYPKWLPF